MQNRVIRITQIMENSRKNYCKGNKQRRKEYVRKGRKGEREREDSEGERKST